MSLQEGPESEEAENVPLILKVLTKALFDTRGTATYARQCLTHW